MTDNNNINQAFVLKILWIDSKDYSVEGYFTNYKKARSRLFQLQAYANDYIKSFTIYRIEIL